MSDSSVFYDNNPVLLSDYDALQGYLGCPKEDPKRRVLEEKIARGEILFPTNQLITKCTQSERDLSPCDDNQHCNWCSACIKGNCTSSIECEYHDYPGLIRFSQISVIVREQNGMESGVEGKDVTGQRRTVFYVALYVPCSHHLFVLQSNFDGYSRLSISGTLNTIEKEMERLEKEMKKYPETMDISSHSKAEGLYQVFEKNYH